MTATDLPPLPPIERLQALLFDAARLGRDDMIPALLQAGADIAARDEKGHTALILASYNGHESTTALLLDAGAAPDDGDATRGNTALMGVAFKGYPAIVRLLLARGATADARNMAGQTALMNATMFGHIEIVDLLLAAGADPYAEDAAGNTPATIAEAQGNTVMVGRIGAG